MTEIKVSSKTEDGQAEERNINNRTKETERRTYDRKKDKQQNRRQIDQ